jgi:hemoglobin
MRVGRRGISGILLVTLGVTMLAACATTKPAEPSLYKRLGGREGIKGVVDEFVAVLMADPRVNARFKALKAPDLERLKTNAADQVCAASGGPCSYLGKDMKSAHKGMRITEAEWNATVEDLVKALDKKGVPKKEQQELLGLLGPMKADIVGQ